MTEWAFRTIIVTAEAAPQARKLAAALAEGEAGAGMWATGLSPTGASPATHYISSGMIEEWFALLLGSAETLAFVTALPLAACEALLSQADITEEPPFEALGRLGLQIVQESKETP